MSAGSEPTSSRGPRPPSIVSTRRTLHSRDQSEEQRQVAVATTAHRAAPRRAGAKAVWPPSQHRSIADLLHHSQPPSPMTYFPNPSTFTSDPQPASIVPSIQTSPSISSARLGGSSSFGGSSDSDLDNTARTPRVPGNELQFQQQQQFYYPTPTATHAYTMPQPTATHPGPAGSPRISGGGGSGGGGGGGVGRSNSRRSASVAAQRSNYGSTGSHHSSAALRSIGGASSSSVASIGGGGGGMSVSDALGLHGAGPGSGPGLGLSTSPNIDPRRISSTPGGIVIPGPSSVRRRPDEPYSAGSVPHSHHAHSHSQPVTANGTPRYRRGEAEGLSSSFYGMQNVHGASFGSAHGSTGGRHRRGVSVTSMLAPVTQSLSSPRPVSPSGSVYRRLKHTASQIGFHRPATYDDQSDYGNDDPDDDGKRANGTRVWYSSYITIDWLHDAIKESSRIRRLRTMARRSVRGAIRNAWDRTQGWVIATIVGVLTAVVAFLIIRTEMAMFDLKDGYCTSSWGTAKRFCCAPRKGPSTGEEEDCGDWVEWGTLFGGGAGGKDGAEGGGDGTIAPMFSEPEFIAYFIIAIGLACTASALTYYLTSSATHVTSKDSAFLGPVDVDSPLTPNTIKLPSERQPLLLEEVEEETASQPPSPPVDPPRPVIYMAAGSGIPEIKTILSGFVIHGYLGMSTLLVKSIGLALSVGSGLSLGKEGPFVHISSCIANIVSRAFQKYEQNEAKRREILSTACAAGVAVSFGAPIGGVLFSLEEVSYYFPPKVMWRAFWCAAMAAITLKALNPYGNGSIVLFAVTYTKEYHYWEFGVFILLGIFGGLYGALFSRLNILWSREVRKGTWVVRHPIFEVAMVTAITTIVSFMNPYTRLGGTELVAKLFAECSVDSTSSLCVDRTLSIWPIISAVGGALLIKASLTIITFGVVLPAGIFIPSLVIGACFGRIVGVLLEYAEFHHSHLPIFDVCRTQACVVPGIYAMVGAAATLAGVTRTTVSLAVIMFELTASLNYVIPVMLAVLIAKTVADSIEKRGIYELVIELKKLPYLSNKEEYLWGGRLVSEVMDREAPTLRADKPHTVRELTGRLLELVRLGYADAGLPVLVKEAAADREGRPYPVLRVLGFLGINELEHALTALADEPDAVVNLLPDELGLHSSRMSIFSFSESHEGRHNPYDLSQYLDRAPITVQVHSPLELVQQMFVKLGAREILVSDSKGTYRGALYKKQWIAFLDELEHAHLEA